MLTRKDAMTVLHSGSNNKYSSNWSKAFGKGKPEASKGTGKKSTKKAAKKS